MIYPCTRWFAFVASVAIFLSAPLASADELLNDTMSRASRTATPTASGAQWFSIGPGITATYAPNDLKLTHASGSAGQLLGYLTTASAPINLAVGQTLKATFTFSLVGGLGTTNGDTSVRIGLFNTGAQRITADITTLSSSGTFTNYNGYAAMFSPANSGSSIRKRIPSAGTNQTNLIGTATTVYSAALASGTSQALQSNVNYTGVLTATRTASGVAFSFALSGGSLSGYQLTYSDTTASPVLSFDAIAFGWSTGVVQAGGGLAVRTLTVDLGASNELNPTDPAANPDPGRPFIWVRNSEKAAILSKIAANSWAQSVRDGMIARVAANVASHQANRDAFLRGLPVDWTTGQYRTMTNTSDPNGVRSKSTSKFNAALDSAVLYYLTGETKYAQLAADVLHNVVKTLLAVAPSTDLGNGGWIIRNDLLLEARVLGTHMPIVYDFIRTFLETNKVWDVMAGGLADFNYYQTQQMFRTYYQLVCDHGNNTNNWSALESTCMLNSLLALSDPTERAAALNIYLVPGTGRQSSLKEDYSEYPQPDSIWPESLQYASAVGSIRSTHMVMLERYDPTLKLFNAYPNYPLSLSRISYLRYPNGEQISFGDGERKTGGEPYFDYEVIYQHAKAIGRQDLVAQFGAAIKRGMDAGKHNRAALLAYVDLDMHNEPLQLLWFTPEITEAGVPQVFTTTDRVAHAGLTLQRNLSSAGSLYGLMGFVGGAAHTHSHASGMSMELYGVGQVLGAKSGKGDYTSDLHENYYRVFASNNTIIVNGASRGEGGWSDIAINTVATAAMEPAVAQSPVSSNHSFTTSTFSDNKGSAAEATQQRTLGIIRTSPTTGYYVDIFRSDSSLGTEYHDYIYRNVGDSVSLETDAGPLALTSAPTRFASDIGDTYQQPGWRYFTNTEVSAATAATVRANFSATLPAGQTQMRMHMPGSSGREYARVMSPSILDAPSPYHTRLAPAVVIRKSGSAWNQPFAAVFEPHLGAAGSGTVKTVATLEKSSVVVGLQVGSTVAGRNIVQYVLSNPNATDVYDDPARELSFRGRYAVVTDYGDGSGTLYIGEGSSLVFKGNSVASSNGANTQAYVEFAAGQSPVVKSNQSVVVLTPPTLVAPATATGMYGVPFSVTISGTGQPAPVLSTTSALPPGLQFNAQAGTLSGTPAAAGNFSVQFVATNSAGTASSTLAITIARAPASATLQNLTQTYTGQPLAPTVVTVPANLPVTFAFDGGSTPTNAGGYAVTATITDPNYVGSAGGIFVIEKASAAVTLQNLTQTYTGQLLTPTVVTVPANLPVALAFASGSTPTDAGSYGVTATVTSPNYVGAASGTLVIEKAAATVTLQNLMQTYSGQALAPTVVTVPTNLPVALTFAGGSTPTDAGNYGVTATVTSPNYVGAASGTFVIEKAQATVTLQNLTQTYTGQPLTPNVVTVPANLPVALAFASGSTPIDAGGYGVTATVTSPNYVGAASGTLVIEKASATVALFGLTPTYDGTPRIVTATTVPTGLAVALTYDGSATAPTNAGTYAVAATITDANYTGVVTDTLTVAKATATLALSNTAQTYDATAKSVTVTTVPAALAYAVTYDGGATAPTNAGTYAVAANVTAANYTGAIAGSLTIEKAVAPVTISSLDQTYDGSPKSVTTATSPAGLTVNVTYDSSPVAPTAAGSYSVVASIAHANYRGSSSATLVIAPATASISLGGLAQRYDGSPKSVTTTITPTGLALTVTYNGSATAPTAPGAYAVVATTTASNYTGTAEGTLVISTAVVVRHAPSLNGGLVGSLQVLLPESTTLNGNAFISGDLLVPGTPTVQLNGRPTYAGTLDAAGAVAPANYTVTLNGNALLRHVVRRTDAVPLPTVNAPPTPTGTRDVELTKPGQAIGSFATLRNLTINDNAGSVAVPAGTYGTLTADGKASFVFGVAGATTPSVYQLQGLKMDGNSQLQIVGPVILHLAKSATLDGNVISAGDSTWLTMHVASGGLTLNGKVTVRGSVIAPSGTVTINGNATLFGSVVADRLTINGNGLLDSTP